MRIRIYFADTDCGQIVYHANYITYCERARSEIFFNAKIHPYIQDTGFVVRKIEANFIASARLGDVIEVSTKIVEMRNSITKIYQEIHKVYDGIANQDTHIKLFDMHVLVAFVDVKHAKAIKMPDEMKALLLTLESKPNA